MSQLGETNRERRTEYLATIPAAIMKCFTGGDASHHLAAVIGVVTIATIVLWDRFAPKKISFISRSPAGNYYCHNFLAYRSFDVIPLSVPEE